MHKLILSLALLLASVPAWAQNAPTTFTTVRITSTSDTALCVGGSGVTPASCVGGIKAGNIEIRKDQVGRTAIRVNNDTATGFAGIEFYDGATPTGFLQFQNNGHMHLATSISGRDVLLRPEGTTALTAAVVGGIPGIIPVNVAIGTATLNDHRAIHINRSYSDATAGYNIHSTLTHSGAISAAGIHSSILRGGSSTADHIVAFQATSAHGGTALLNHVYGYFSSRTHSTGSSATNSYAFYAGTPTGAGTVTNNYGLYIEDQGAFGSNAWAIYTGTGRVHFGDSVNATGYQVSGVAQQNVASGQAPTFTGTNFTGIPWAGVSKSGSSLADLATRAVANLSDGSNVALLNAASQMFTGNTLSISKQQVGTTSLQVVNNLGSAGAHALLLIGSEAGGGDGYIEFNVGGGGGSWYYGMDNSDSDALVWSRTGIGSSNTMKLTTAGVLTVPAGVTVSAYTNAAGTLSGSAVAGMVFQGIAGSSASFTWINAGGSSDLMSLTAAGVLTVSTVIGNVTGNVSGTAGAVDAANITGTTLAAGVTASSLTSLGTLGSLIVSGSIDNSTGGINAGYYDVGGVSGCSGVPDVATLGIATTCSTPAEARARVLQDIPDRLGFVEGTVRILTDLPGRMERLEREVARLTNLVAVLGGVR